MTSREESLGRLVRLSIIILHIIQLPRLLLFSPIFKIFHFHNDPKYWKTGIISLFFWTGIGYMLLEISPILITYRRPFVRLLWSEWLLVQCRDIFFQSIISETDISINLQVEVIPWWLGISVVSSQWCILHRGCVPCIEVCQTRFLCYPSYSSHPSTFYIGWGKYHVSNWLC